MRNILGLKPFAFLFLFFMAAPVFADQAESAKGFTFDSQVITNTQALPEGALIAFDQSAQVSKNIPQALTLNGGTVGKTQTAMKFVVMEQPQHGTLDLSSLGTGGVTYTPAADFEGTDSFTFTVDAGGVAAKPATVKLEVVPGAVAPPAAPPAASGSGTVTDPLTLELNKKSDAFFKEQQARRIEFFADLRQKDFSSEEEQKRILEFRQDEAKREEKFRRQRQRLTQNEGEDGGFLDTPDRIAEDIALFFKLREPSMEELNKQRDDFTAKAKEKRTAFFRDIQNQDLEPEEKIQKIRDFEEAALKSRTRFFEKRREIIQKQAQNAGGDDDKTDVELKDEIIQFFKDQL